MKLFYDENTQFFYLLCSLFRQKASGWINKTLLLIKQHITYMNISRYANIDKFVNIRYIFLLARLAYSWLFQLAQMWKLLAPGVGLGDLLTPACIFFCKHPAYFSARLWVWLIILVQINLFTLLRGSCCDWKPTLYKYIVNILMEKL